MDLPTLNSTMALAMELDSSGEAFWSAYKPWLLSHGYTLYDCLGICDSNIGVSSTNYYQASHPYAVLPPDSPPDGGEFYRLQRFVMFARDDLGREVVIKVASNRGQEVLVNRLLLGFPELYDPDQFPSVLPPLRILPSPHDYSFIITPRWGHIPMRSFLVNWDSNPFRQSRLPFYPFKTVDQVLEWVLSLLKALMFLHSRKIVHRDIHYGNFLVNYLTFDLSRSVGDFEAHLNGEYGAPVRYGLFDFNLSVVFPGDFGKEDCRLGEKYINQGTRFHDAPQVMQGELDYDPFAFDVECMGYVLIRHLASLVPDVPLLAVLFDKMTTHDLTSRFTSLDAFQFCNFIRGSLLKEQLLFPPPLTNDNFREFVQEVPWDTLDPNFIATWLPYRTPPIRPSIRVFRWIASIEVGRMLIRTIRRWLRSGPPKGHDLASGTFL